MKHLITLVILLVSLNSFSQTVTGRWKGGCSWVEDLAALTLTIEDGGGTRFAGHALEHSYLKLSDSVKEELTHTFDFSLIMKDEMTGVIPVNTVTNIVFTHVKDGKTTVQRFDNYAKYNKKVGTDYMVCLCDDNKELLFGYDTKYNYMEFECTDNKIYWSLMQTRPVKPEEVVVQETKQVTVPVLIVHQTPEGEFVPTDTVLLKRDMPFWNNEEEKVKYLSKMLNASIGD